MSVAGEVALLEPARLRVITGGTLQISPPFVVIENDLRLPADALDDELDAAAA